MDNRYVRFFTDEFSDVKGKYEEGNEERGSSCVGGRENDAAFYFYPYPIILFRWINRGRWMW